MSTSHLSLSLPHTVARLGGAAPQPVAPSRRGPSRHSAAAEALTALVDWLRGAEPLLRQWLDAFAERHAQGLSSRLPLDEHHAWLDAVSDLPDAAFGAAERLLGGPPTPFELAVVGAVVGMQSSPLLHLSAERASGAVGTRGMTPALAIACFGACDADVAESLAPDSRLVARGLVAPSGPAGPTGSWLTVPLVLCDAMRRAARSSAPGGPAASAVHVLPSGSLVRVPPSSASVEPAFAPVGVRSAVHAWLQAKGLRGGIIAIRGSAGAGQEAFATSTSQDFGYPAVRVSGRALAHHPRPASAWAELRAERVVWGSAIILEHADELLRQDCAVADELCTLVRLAAAPLWLLMADDSGPIAAKLRAPALSVRWDAPTAEDRIQLWEVALPAELELSDDIDLMALATAFEFDASATCRAAEFAVRLAANDDIAQGRVAQSHLQQAAWYVLMADAPGDLSLVPPRRRLSDVVLADQLSSRAQEIVSACHYRDRVLREWGFSQRLSTGTGVTVLLDGPPGTGKTLLAEALAGELARPLYRVSLPDVLSKWVGETEKHLRDVFRRARAVHAVLLFDEADSLFAARSADASTPAARFANTEVNLLLQEIERFEGLCVLTTNHFGALDPALLRRIQHRLRFDTPTESERTEIWRALCPPQAPLAKDVQFQELAQQFDLAGGHIKNALLRAAYRAAERGGAICQDLLTQACEDECLATGKLVMQRAKPLAEENPGS